MITETAGGTRELRRFITERLEDGVARAQEFLDGRPAGAARAVMVHDGYVTLESGRTDALIVTARSFVGPLSLTMVVPYRDASAGFAVFRPKLVAIEPSDTVTDTIVDRFFAGVDSHTETAAVWNAHLDQRK